jgi:hypothetical protein
MPWRLRAHICRSIEWRRFPRTDIPPSEPLGCIRWFCHSPLSSDDARESGCIVRLKLARKGAAGLEKDTAARPHGVVAQCIARSRGDFAALTMHVGIKPPLPGSLDIDEQVIK